MAGNAHDVAGSKRIGRAIDDPVGRDETARHFNLDAEIPPQTDLLQRDLIAVANYRGFQAMLPEQYRACRYQHDVWITRKVQLSFDIGARLKQPIRVVRLKFDEQRSR